MSIFLYIIYKFFRFYFISVILFKNIFFNYVSSLKCSKQVFVCNIVIIIIIIILNYKMYIDMQKKSNAMQ